MADELRLGVAFALSGAATLGLLPLAIRTARLTNFYDHPVGYKGHARATPYLGGAALLGGFLVAATALGSSQQRDLAIIGCAVFLFLVGTLDDRVNLGPLVRIAAEALSAAVLWAAGIGWEITASPVLNFVISMVWIVGLVNAFNLMDNIDGACGAVGAVAAIGVGVLAVTAGDPTLAVLAFSAAGACVAFLTKNLSRPAQIFLGDGGSMPLGLIVAAVVMATPMEGDGWAVILASLPTVGVPLLDMARVIFSRTRRGVPVLSGARDHVTHLLLPWVGTPQRVAAILAVVQAVFCGAAILAQRSGAGTVRAAGVVFLVAGVVVLVLVELPAWAPRRQES